MNQFLSSTKKIAGLSVIGLAALSGCALSTGADATEDVASTQSALTAQPEVSYPIDVGFGIERYVKKQCGDVCVKWNEPRIIKPGFTTPRECIKWIPNCGTQLPPMPKGTELYADHDSAIANIPFTAYYQGPDWSYQGCGPQAIQNVLHYYGVDKRIQDIAPYVSAFHVPLSSNIATWPDDVVQGLSNLLNAWGDGTFNVWRDSNSDVRWETRDAMTSGNPAVLLVNGGDHYQMVSGLKSNEYYVNDYSGLDNWRTEADMQLALGFPAAWGGMATNGTKGYIDNTVIRVNRTPRLSDRGFELQSSRALTAPWFGADPAQAHLISSGVDIGLGYAFAGSNNAFVYADNGSYGFGAVNQWVTVRPNTNYVVGGWFRTSATFGLGYFSVRGDNSVNNAVLSEIKLDTPIQGAYQYRTFSFNSGSSTAAIMYAGFWANGTIQWLQMDDLTLVQSH